MSIIKIKCIDQTLTFTNTPVIACGGMQEDFVSFEFCSQWDGFARTAVFWRSPEEPYHNLLDDFDTCEIPPEVTAEAGIIYFGVFGLDANGRRRTSEVLSYRIGEGAITEGTRPSEPTPEIYDQLLAQYAEMLYALRSKADKVVNAEEGNLAELDADGNLVDSGKKLTDLTGVHIGEIEPDAGPVLWFNTSGINPATDEAVVLDLNEDETGGVVSTEVDGEQYGIDNATVNTEPEDEGVYDFNIEN